MTWKCKRCGECCKFITFQALFSEDEREWLNAHEDVKVVGNRVIISSQCRWLHRIGNHYTCDLHAAGKKPKMCEEAGKVECKLAKEWYKEIC